MPRYTETLTIAGELDALDERLDAAADDVTALEAEIDDHDGEPPAPLLDDYQNALERGQRLDRYRNGLAWALDPDDGRDPITEVTVGALTAGEISTVTDRTASLSEKKASDWGVPSTLVALEGANQNEYVAAGLADAPFINDGDDHADVVGAVADCAPQFVAWLASQIDDVSAPATEGNGFAARVEERRTTDSRGSTTAEQS